MLLRPIQERFKKKCVKALKKHGNTMGVAATGFGKTVVLSAIGSEFDCRQLVIQHSNEILTQNLKKYSVFNEGKKLGLFNADIKTFRNDTTFASIQTLHRYVDQIPNDIGLVITDEAHRAICPTYMKVYDATKEKNKKCKFFFTTATPQRGDGKSLRKVCNNIGDWVTIKELVGLGFLVPPRAFIVDINRTQGQLLSLGNVSAGEQHQVADILNKKPINAEVVRNWKEIGGDRQTVVFCSTVAHAKDVCAEFVSAGVAAECVHGEMPQQAVTHILNRLRDGKIQVVVNVAKLTEGWDCPPVSCIVLLRMMSCKSAMLQMIGRGLRTVSPEEFPDAKPKRDCVVIDMGVSIIQHGDLEQLDGLHEERESQKGEVTTKTCPTEWGEKYRYPDRNGNTGCGAELPAQTKSCPFCGFQFERMDGEEDEFAPSVSLTEVDLLNASPFRWANLFGSDCLLMAGGFDAWVGVFSPDGGETFHALGHSKSHPGHINKLCVSSRLIAISAADDFLRARESGSAAKKSKRWLDEPASERQVELLNRFGYGLSAGFFGTKMSKYYASLHCNFQFNRHLIEGAIGV